MANDEHVAIVQQGAHAIAKWREENPDARLDLSGADLSGARLVLANLSGANLRSAKLGNANLRDSSLRRAYLRSADLTNTDLFRADLSRADLEGATLAGDLSRANLNCANLRGAEVFNTDFNDTDLRCASLNGAEFDGAKLCNVDLSTVEGLDTVLHWGPSTIGVDTLSNSKGRISEVFLRGCGLTAWEIINARMYDPALTPHEITELQVQTFDKRTHAVAIGGVFISYSRNDDTFVDDLYAKLTELGVSVWLDRHDMDAGDLQKQVARAVRVNDIVLLVLSKASVESDWVENELDMARDKEKQDERDVLCPIAIDGSWKAKLENSSSDRHLWRTLTKKNILDFSCDFDEPFDKLIRGLKKNY